MKKKQNKLECHVTLQFPAKMKMWTVTKYIYLSLRYSHILYASMSDVALLMLTGLSHLTIKQCVDIKGNLLLILQYL